MNNINKANLFFRKPFREAHSIAGELVNKAEKLNLSLDQLNAHQISGKIKNIYLSYITQDDVLTEKGVV